MMERNSYYKSFKKSILLSILFLISRSRHSCMGIDGSELSTNFNQGQQSPDSFHRIDKWPTPFIYYEISHQFNSSSRRIIRQAMTEISANTCIRFVPRTRKTKDYIFIQRKPNLGCRTKLGNRGGRQYLTLDNSRCIQHGRIMHELMHSLGFPHEHQRPDRDDYVEIYWNNIKDDDIPQFIKRPSSWEYSMGFPYDYGSITHYANLSPTASININQPILRPKKSTKVMGQRESLSPLDVQKINTLYRCSPVDDKYWNYINYEAWL